MKLSQPHFYVWRCILLGKKASFKAFWVMTAINLSTGTTVSLNEAYCQCSDGVRLTAVRGLKRTFCLSPRQMNKCGARLEIYSQRIDGTSSTANPTSTRMYWPWHNPGRGGKADSAWEWLSNYCTSDPHDDKSTGVKICRPIFQTDSVHPNLFMNIKYICVCV